MTDVNQTKRASIMRIKLSITIAAICSAVLGGCVTASPPAYKDALTGLSNNVAAGAPEGKSVAVRSSLALVPSSNTELYLKSIETNTATLTSVIIPNTAAIKDTDPTYVINRAVKVVVDRFPEAELLDDLAAARSKKKKSTIVMDVQVALGKLSGQTTTAAITFVVLDERQRPISKISGRGTATIPYPAFSYGVQPATDQALQEIDAKLAAIGPHS